jgi:protein involved in polysaccharide export with SLBB domain
MLCSAVARVREIVSRGGIAVAIFILPALGFAMGCSSSAGRSEPQASGLAPSALSPDQCAANAAAMRASMTTRTERSYLIQPGDNLGVDFYLNQEFNQDVIVGPDGKIALRAIGVVPASGMTAEQLAQQLNQAYSSELRSPGVSVAVKNMPSRLVFVQGQVAKPGAFPLEPGMTALQAVAEAGGLTPDAGDKAVLIRRDACEVPYASELDLARAVDHPDANEDVLIQSRDVVVVPRSGIANLNLWVQHYVRGLMPITPYAPLPL